MFARVHHGQSQAGLWLLLAAALLMRALVPVGWMPATEGENPFAIRICEDQLSAPPPPKMHNAHAGHASHHGGGMKAVTGDESHDNHDAHKDQGSKPCAFAGFATGALPVDGAVALIVILPAVQLRAAAIARILVRKLDWVMPPGRGPPLTV